jgi:hypothetical protein
VGVSSRLGGTTSNSKSSSINISKVVDQQRGDGKKFSSSNSSTPIRKSTPRQEVDEDVDSDTSSLNKNEQQPARRPSRKSIEESDTTPKETARKEKRSRKQLRYSYRKPTSPTEKKHYEELGIKLIPRTE